ncbi:argininosuccinate lyase [Candidatus Nitrososphaera evergladensis SR1]|jgi:argininosuccinate lyase|uniref:Argininosuccinate lyase n=1 Tax=Candidatus Nitrososphaera evergladensis SR1 TaxID=1459636 RepID=A0A075MR14_9ARCH|nr:argininosuccinate lyase [Candidatus Nitrososphaera evergladensis]AIF83648.1 argininosuccinate lyase [Candidatus Nitrososphaera evergladensis SR1]
MYRSRPKGRMDDDVLAFLSSTKHDQSILYYDIVGSEAHSVMLHEIGIISRQELKKILAALEAAKKNPGLIDTEGAEDIHEALEAFVIKQAGIDAGGKMHTARSRNDQVVLDIRMKVRDDINELCTALADLIDSLVKKAEKNKDAIMPLYTHLQQGQLGTFSHVMLAYADALCRDFERIYNTFGRINQSPLGSCAIAGTSIGIDRKRTATLLGFDGLMLNSLDATTSRDSFVEYVAALAILASTLARMAEDLIIWSTQEFGFVELDDRYSSTSSAMPQKKNPDPLELTRAKAAIIAGRLASMLGMVKGLPSGYSRDLQDIKPQLLEASATATSTVKVTNGVISTLTVKKKKMLDTSAKSYAISLDIAEQLVAKGVPFRSAHKVVGALVSRAAEKDIPLAALETKEISFALEQAKQNGIKPDELAKIVKEMTPEKSIESRRSAGSPNPKEQDEMIKTAKSRLAGYREGTQKRTKYVKDSLDILAKTVARYVQA